MKKWYVKSEDGVLVPATEAQIADPKIPKIEVDDSPPIATPIDPISELTGVIRSMSGDFKSTVDKMNEQMAAYKEASKRGFPLPGGPEPPPGSDPDEMAKFFRLPNGKAYEPAAQGKRLMDKLVHPTYQIKEENRVEMAKFFSLFLRATVHQDYKARDTFWEYFGPQIKTAVGDSGNVFPLHDALPNDLIVIYIATPIIFSPSL